MEDYRVHLDFYDGPMDLLLYLVRRNEVDIHDIPIARITDQYCRWVEMMRAIDINLAGEFLVMAAWLIEIKSRMLLPTEPVGGEGQEGESSAAAELADPRAELIRQLLAYKQFKDLADELGEAAAEQALRHPRAGIDWKAIAPDDADEPALDIADVQIWDLFEAFGRLMEQTGRFRDHQVTYDDTPIHEHAAALVEHLSASGPTRFENLFEGRNRGEILGLFLAMLELIRRNELRIEQEEPFAPIYLMLREQVTEADASAEQPNDAPDEPEPAPAPKSKPWEKQADAPKPDGVGVTWVDPAEMEEMLDDDLREIDRALRGIKIPADADKLLQQAVEAGEGGQPKPADDADAASADESAGDADSPPDTDAPPSDALDNSENAPDEEQSPQP